MRCWPQAAPWPCSPRGSATRGPTSLPSRPEPPAWPSAVPCRWPSSRRAWSTATRLPSAMRSCCAPARPSPGRTWPNGARATRPWPSSPPASAPVCNPSPCTIQMCAAWPWPRSWAGSWPRPRVAGWTWKPCGSGFAPWSRPWQPSVPRCWRTWRCGFVRSSPGSGRRACAQIRSAIPTPVPRSAAGCPVPPFAWELLCSSGRWPCCIGPPTAWWAGLRGTSQTKGIRPPPSSCWGGS